MATAREHYQSVLAQLAQVQNVSDDLLDTPGVIEILREMDDLADELVSVLG